MTVTHRDLPNRMRRAASMVYVLRPMNLIIVAAGVWVGATLSATDGTGAFPFWATLSAMALTAAGNAHNDWSDGDKDRINRPDRALPSGTISRSSLLLLAGGLFAAGALALIPLSPAHAVLFGLNAAGLVLYNMWGSRRPLVGNVLVAALVGSSLVFGALEEGVNERVFVAAAFAAAATLARELVKDVQDMEGDRAVGARTLAVAIGAPATFRVVNLVLLLLVPATLLPFLFLDFGGTYLLGMGVTNALLLASAPGKAREAAHSSRLLKWAMVAGTVALLFAESRII